MKNLLQKASIVASPPLRIKMGKAAREKAEREFSLDKVVQKHLEIYESLIKDNWKLDILYYNNSSYMLRKKL